MAARNRAVGGLTRSLDDEHRKELRMVLKADTQGSLEAAVASLNRLGTDEIQVNILHAATGSISDADVMLASASEAVILGFNSQEENTAARLAEQEGVRLDSFDVIYHMVEHVEKLMLGQLDAEITVVETGKAEVRQLFSIGKTVTVAGCMVTEGKVVRNGLVDVLRQGKSVADNVSLDALRRFKDDVKEVAQGYECGITLQRFNALELGDVMVFKIKESKARTAL